MTSSSYASPPRGLSFRAQLMFVLVTLTVSSTVVLGWLAYSTSRDIIEGNATQAVGVAANARRTALLQRLKRQQERAAAFLNTARTACRSEGGAQTTCLRQRLEEFANTEGSAAAQLAEGDTATVSVGEKSATLEHARPPAPDQLARFFFDDDRQPFYLIRAKSALEDASLTLLFGTQSINTIFADRNGLGESGETFLADAQGFFLTPPRYPSHSGHSHPIDAKPMQMCLSGRDSEVLDKDYRKADIIHGFRYVREIGGGCIMAHVDQAEAFAPAHALAVKVAGVATLFAALAVGFSFAFARLLARPFGELTARALALQAEDFASAPPINGPAEVQTFSRAFDAMARSISGSRAALVRSEERYRRLVELSPDGIIVHSEGLIIFANTAATLLLGASDASQLIGLPVIDLIHPDYRQVVEERGSQTREEGVTAPPLEEKFLRFDGTYLDVEVRETTLNYEDRSAVQVVLRDTTKRKQSEQALVEQLRLAALGAEVGTALIQSDSLPDTLRRCAEIMVSRLDAAFARIWTLNEAGDVLELQASAGLYTHLDGPHARVPVGQFKIGLIARERVPRLTNDVQNDSRVSDKEWARREGMVAFAGYPLIVENRLVGVVALFARRALTQNTLDSLATVANGIALGIERKRIEEERARLLSSEQQARQTAEEANRTKDEFLATLSHTSCAHR